MWVGIGVGIGRNRFATGIFNDYALRVNADGGITEAGQCVDAVTGLLLNASLLLIPSGYKGGKLYAEIPTNGNGDLTWTRGSDAFRTNASGLIQRVPWNLLLNTNTFSGWSLEGGALTSGFSAPDGTTTAYKYVQTTGGLYSGSSTATSGSKIATIWIKSVSGTSITCNLQDGGSGNNTVVTVTGDWQLFTATYTTSTSRPSLYVWGISNASGIYVWHPQLVEGTTAQTYLPTTDRLNFPRLDYTYGSCPAALLEPQRTNLNLYSDDFGNAYWSKFQASVTTNVTTSPDGSTNADKLIEDSTTNFHSVFINTAFSVTIGQAYSRSVYAKADGRNWISLLITDSTLYRAFFDLQNGVVGNVSTGITATIQSVGSGWYRCQVTRTAASTSFSSMAVELASANGTGSYTGNGTSGVFIYGAQIEAGAYPTTYIPTTSATATRVADTFSRNNIYTNGLISASGGTWFVSLVNNIVYARDTFTLGLYISDTTNISSNNINIRTGGTARLAINKVIAGISTALYLTTTDTTKLAIKWNGTTADIFVNGTKVVSATAFTPTNMEFLRGDTTQVPVFIQQMALFPTPLSDTDCATLTT